MAKWTEDDIPDLSGKKVIVTGANSGLGFHGARMFAENNADVVMACRSLERANSAKEEIEPGEDGSVEVMELDLANLDSIKSFADNFIDSYDELHFLCNNAGIMAIPRKTTEDGFEMQFGVNHLGHYALTGHLINTLIDTDDESRVVNQSSGMHERGEMNFDDLHGEKNYDRWGAYGQSKLANLLHAYELDRKLDENNVESVKSLGVHPGYSATNLQRRGPEMMGKKLRLWFMKAANKVVAQSPARGALPILYASTHPEIEGKEYIGPDGFMGLRGYPEKQRSTKASYDEKDAERLWKISEELTNVEYGL